MHIEKEYYQKELNKSIVWIIFGVATCIIGIVFLKKTDSKSSFYHTGCNHNNQLGNYCSKCGIGLFDGAIAKTKTDAQAISLRQSLCGHSGQKELYCSKCGSYLKS